MIFIHRKFHNCLKRGNNLQLLSATFSICHFIKFINVFTSFTSSLTFSCLISELPREMLKISHWHSGSIFPLSAAIVYFMYFEEIYIDNVTSLELLYICVKLSILPLCGDLFITHKAVCLKVCFFLTLTYFSSFLLTAICLLCLFPSFNFQYFYILMFEMCLM